MRVDLMKVDQMRVGQMKVDLMKVDQMRVDQMRFVKTFGPPRNAKEERTKENVTGIMWPKIANWLANCV